MRKRWKVLIAMIALLFGNLLWYGWFSEGSTFSTLRIASILESGYLEMPLRRQELEIDPRKARPRLALGVLLQ
jgi:hypothetical protein